MYARMETYSMFGGVRRPSPSSETTAQQSKSTCLHQKAEANCFGFVLYFRPSVEARRGRETTAELVLEDHAPVEWAGSEATAHY
ncbi:MAG: hypothetical protein WCC12_05285 [Anaerolineales bacterium]